MTKLNISVCIKNPFDFSAQKSLFSWRCHWPRPTQLVAMWWSTIFGTKTPKRGFRWNLKLQFSERLFSRLSKKKENPSSPMEKKRQRSKSEYLKDVSWSVRKQRRLPADCGSPCLDKLPFCNKHFADLQFTDSSLNTSLARYPLRDGNLASHSGKSLVAKIPAVMEVAPCYILPVQCTLFIFTLFTMFTLFELFTLLPPITNTVYFLYSSMFAQLPIQYILVG